MPKNYIPAKYLIKQSGAPGNACIKNQASLVPIDGYFKAYSASGQDVWLPYYNYDEPSIVVSAVGARCGKTFLALEKFAVCANTHVLVIDSKKCYPKFLYYLTNNEDWWEKGGTAQPFVKVKETLQKKIWLPPLSEQQAISAHLDNQCAHIDNIIEKTKASVEEYKKLRQAVITQAVTSKGSQCKLSHISNLKNGLNYHDTDSEKTIKILGVGDFKEYLVLNEKEQFSDLPIDEDISDEYYLKNGDIIFVRSNGSKDLVGRSIMVDCIDYPLVYSGFCIRFRITRTDIAYNKYLLYYFRSHEFKEAIKYQCFGTNINNLSQDMISSLKVYLPSIEEQKEIAAYLDKKCTEIDSLISKKEQFLTELESYKKSMIYEYVTGKKEVPQS